MFTHSWALPILLPSITPKSPPISSIQMSRSLSERVSKMIIEPKKKFFFLYESNFSGGRGRDGGLLKKSLVRLAALCYNTTPLTVCACVRERERREGVPGSVLECSYAPFTTPPRNAMLCKERKREREREHVGSCAKVKKPSERENLISFLPSPHSHTGSCAGDATRGSKSLSLSHTRTHALSLSSARSLFFLSAQVDRIPNLS